MECKECYGEGTVNIGPSCSSPASMCCGGCYETVTCEECKGYGVVEDEEEEEDDFED